MISNCLPLIICDCDDVWMLRNKARLGEDPGTVPELVLKIQPPFNETQWDSSFSSRGKRGALALTWVE